MARRIRRAVGSRRVSTRPAPDGMAYLTILGPLTQVVGAYATLERHARAVLTGGPGAVDAFGRVEQPDGRGRAQIMADAALRWLTGLDLGQAQPVEVNLVMPPDVLFGGPEADTPTRIPGHGTIPAPMARGLVHAHTGDEEAADDDSGSSRAPRRVGPTTNDPASRRAALRDDENNTESLAHCEDLRAAARTDPGASGRTGDGDGDRGRRQGERDEEPQDRGRRAWTVTTPSTSPMAQGRGSLQSEVSVTSLMTPAIDSPP
ncbi:hypothetical protein BN12_270015 [Nostocoides japonicum T1-X7]|uniref:DUF222 domain-containing protein n=1 Tax=Nostocoides japonicum T1-X7 TaxID=1194083 RepID=A0A077M236_9MICO|nr:hypothetical protein [Tetrasphaera japonica]CCH78289.1 hypothetical protein BN12_270015 [Tetrasphaera japonica T1-X7]